MSVIFLRELTNTVYSVSGFGNDNSSLDERIRKLESVVNADTGQITVSKIVSADKNSTIQIKSDIFITQNFEIGGTVTTGGQTIIGNGLIGQTGSTGPTGPPGMTTSFTFDGGHSTNNYSSGPAFDCGTSV
jgi:hypothetical protein